MLSRIKLKRVRKILTSVSRRGVACLLAAALCTLNAPGLLAQDGSEAKLPATPPNNTEPASNLATGQPDFSSRWSFATEITESATMVRPLNFSAVNLTSTEGVTFGKYSPSVPALAPHLDLGGQSGSTASSGSDHHKLFKDLGFVGLGVLAGGITTFALARSSHCASPTAPGACSQLDHAGEIMMPVGGAVAALGFIFAYRHHH